MMIEMMMRIVIFYVRDDYDDHDDLVKTLSYISRIVCPSVINYSQGYIKTQYSNITTIFIIIIIGVMQMMDD